MSSERFFTPDSAVELSELDRVGVLAPHPDDEIFGCGGTLCSLAELGATVTVVIVTGGTKHGKNDGKDLHSIRQKESCTAAALIGLPEPCFWNFSDRGLLDAAELVPCVANWIATERLTHVLAPHPWEMHPDHRALAMALLECLQAPHLLSFEYWGYEVSMPLGQVDTLVNISSQTEKKENAMNLFLSQNTMQRYPEQIAGLNCFRSYSLGSNVTAAEAFCRIDKKRLKTLDLKSPQAVNDLIRKTEEAIAHANKPVLAELTKLKIDYDERLQAITRERREFKRLEREYKNELAVLQSKRSSNLPLRPFMYHIGARLRCIIRRLLLGIAKVF